MKIVGLGIVSVSILLISLQWEIILNGWYLMTERSDLRSIPGFSTAIAHAVFYVAAFGTSLILGVLLMGKHGVQRRRINTITFLLIVSFVLVLELPVYACKFGPGRHSFWNSRIDHFH